jgi:hypothetical protein
MAFTRSQMEWCEPIRVGTVDNLEQLVLLSELHFGVAKNLEHFVGITLVDLGPVVHLDLLDVLLPLLLLV